ncbi:recombination mediator RecR [Fusobacterium sp.]|uniref:recombination mediator RecR n=1 Tax=Fusobacterium sp. TaxID=68766 RepID=UPI002610EBE7|nr:recombination mediator RecR [Fusobacterium sp.]
MSAKHLEILIDEFNKLPGIGRKSATRLAFHIINSDEKEVNNFIKALQDSKSLVKKCKVCGNFCETDTCDICDNMMRDHQTICVVEDSKDIMNLEKTGKYNGVYHILNGKIAPLDGVTPDKLNIKSLLERVTNEDIKEIIFALSSDLEGETTVLYLTKLLKPFGVTVSKLASGIPMGGNIEYADNATIAKALEGREVL